MTSIADGFSFGGALDAIFANSNLANDAGHSVDTFWMRQALLESMKSIGHCNPNPAVGCIIVKDGREIARGHTQPYGGKHAERAAIESLKDKSLLDGATAYVTLEPCAHQGHQPPCSSFLAGLPLKRVVIARTDSDSRVSGRGVRQLIHSGKKVSVGVLSKEITAWNFPFFRTRSSGEPFIAVKWAQTQEGAEARIYSHWLRQKYDAVMIDVETFLREGSKLSVRDCYPIVRQPIKIIFDPSGKLLASQAHVTSPHFIFVRERVSEISNLVQIKISGETILEQITSGFKASEIKAAHGRDLQSLLYEGDTKLLDICDVAHVFARQDLSTLAIFQKFENVCSRKMGDDVLFEFVKREDWLAEVDLCSSH